MNRFLIFLGQRSLKTVSCYCESVYHTKMSPHYLKNAEFVHLDDLMKSGMNVECTEGVKFNTEE